MNFLANPVHHHQIAPGRVRGEERENEWKRQTHTSRSLTGKDLFIWAYALCVSSCVRLFATPWTAAPQASLS